MAAAGFGVWGATRNTTGHSKVGGQVLCSLLSFTTILKLLKMHTIKLMIYLRWCVPPPQKIFLTSEWKMTHFGTFWVLFLQTVVI